MPRTREQDRQRQRQIRKAEATVKIPKCKNPRRRKRLEADDKKWLRFYFGPDCGFPREQTFWYEFTEQQQEMIKAIATAIRYSGDQSLAASRGEGKTSIAERLILKYTLQGVISCSCLFAATSSAAEDSLKEIKRSCERNDLLLEDYPEVCVPVRELQNRTNRAGYMFGSGDRPDDRRKKFKNVELKFQWGNDEISLPQVPGSPSRDAVIATRSLESAVRGLKKKGKRLDVAIIDDADTDETVNNEQQAEKLEKRIDRAIAGLGGQQRSVARVMLCTIQNRTCVAYRFTDPQAKPTWKGKRFRFLARPPIREDLWQKYIETRGRGMQNGDSFGREAHKFYLSHRLEMDEGAIVSNPNRFNPQKLPDGSQDEVSALEHYYNLIHKLGEDSVNTEYNNDPPEDEEVQRTVLTAYHVQQNCRSGLDFQIVPEGTTSLVAGLDIKKLGFHFVVIASDDDARGCIVEYNFHEINAGHLKANTQAVERAILYGLHEWRENVDATHFLDVHGNEYPLNFALIDEGWIEETWAQQPARQFSAESGLERFMSCKGWDSGRYREPQQRRVIVGERCHISFGRNKIQHVNWDADHWKQAVHDGFLTAPGEPGSLALFNPPQTKIGRRQQPHMSYAKHVTAEVWEERFVPGFKGWVKKWWKVGSQNHYFDATAQALVARSLLGCSVLPKQKQPGANGQSQQSQNQVVHPPVEVGYVPSGHGGSYSRSW